nr:MAG TPA: hypothetical protein [Caudoviricetes sp.]
MILYTLLHLITYHLLMLLILPIHWTKMDG